MKQLHTPPNKKIYDTNPEFPDLFWECLQQNKGSSIVTIWTIYHVEILCCFLCGQVYMEYESR